MLSPTTYKWVSIRREGIEIVIYHYLSFTLKVLTAFYEYQVLIIFK